MDELSIFTGNANRPLAGAICRELRIPLGDADVFQFSNENIFVKINENVRGKDIFITHVRAEIAEVLTGRQHGRISADEITVFKSVGLALEDVAAASVALQHVGL